MDKLNKMMQDSKTSLLKIKCGKCSAGVTLPTGLTIKLPILTSKGSPRRVKGLGVVKEDPSCIKCGTTFPEGYREVKGEYLYRTKPIWQSGKFNRLA